MPDPVAIAALGVVTPVGLDAKQTAAAVGAGVSSVREIDEEGWLGKDENPYRGGFLDEECLDGLHRKTYGVEEDSDPGRHLRLAGTALSQLRAALEGSPAPPPLVLGVAAQDRLPDDSPERFLDNLMRQAQLRLDLAGSEVIFGGQAAGLLAVRQACLRLGRGERGPIIAGGVDSYIDFGRLTGLDLDRRILNDANLDGFLPGEAAAFVLLARHKPEAPQAGTIGLIQGTAAGFEKGHRGSEEPLLGDGLSETLAGLFAELPEALRPCRDVYANLNGEANGAKEWGIAYLRNKPSFAEDHQLHHPAECMGETGAAMGPVLVAIAATQLSAGATAGPSLIWCAADGGERAALYLSRAAAGETRSA